MAVINASEPISSAMSLTFSYSYKCLNNSHQVINQNDANYVRVSNMLYQNIILIRRFGKMLFPKNSITRPLQRIVGYLYSIYKVKKTHIYHHSIRHHVVQTHRQPTMGFRGRVILFFGNNILPKRRIRMIFWHNMFETPQ